MARKIPENHAIQALTAAEIADVHGGSTVLLDGMAVEMSDTTLRALLTSGAARAIVVKGIDNTEPVGGGYGRIRIF